MRARRPDDEGADAGPRSSPPGTMRLCVATRTVRPVSDMIRFVEGPGGEVVPDVKHRLPGRGVWVSARRAAVAKAIKEKAFGRGLRSDVRVAADFIDRLDSLLERSAIDALAIAGKARRVVCGMAKVEAALSSRTVAAVLNASDAGSDGVRKVVAAAKRALGSEAANVPVIDIFASAQLDLAFGRANVVHAALLTGRDSNAVLARCATLERFRKDDGGGQGGSDRASLRAVTACEPVEREAARDCTAGPGGSNGDTKDYKAGAALLRIDVDDRSQH